MSSRRDHSPPRHPSPPRDPSPPGDQPPARQSFTVSEATDADIDAQVRLALATWPQIDPEVEGIISRIAKAERYLAGEARTTLDRVGLTKEEFKVFLALHGGSRSHGSLCRELKVSTGTMTNRLDKLERAGLV